MGDRSAEPRKRRAGGERTRRNHTEFTASSESRGPLFLLRTSPPPHHHFAPLPVHLASTSTVSTSPSFAQKRPVALIIREYVAVMLSIPPANSNRAHPPTWWYLAGKVAARLAIPAFLCWLWP